jgi:MoaA/NifB/PqqE/SkfB family radical SAM enzyme
MKSQSVKEIWNSPTAQKLRRSILDGSFEYCNATRCPFLQTVSGPVQTINEVSDPDLKKVISENITVLSYGPKEINCSYDKSCNLSCPSCRNEKIIEIELEDEILAIQEKLKSQALHDAETIYVTGSGDAFGSPYFRKLIRTLDPDEMPRLKRIHLHTNGLLWTPENWKRIPEQVRALITTAEISIDAATTGTYAINRRGGNFEKLLKNLEFIASLHKLGPLGSVTISMVVQENNIHEMVDFVRLGQRFGFDTVYFSQLVNWGTFTDEEYRRRAVHRREHPRHSEFIEVLKKDIFKEQIVYLGNLTES